MVSEGFMSELELCIWCLIGRELTCCRRAWKNWARTLEIPDRIAAWTVERTIGDDKRILEVLTA